MLAPGTSVQVLTPIEERERLLRELGVEVVVPVTFTWEMSQIRATSFVALLQRYLGMKGMVVGPDFALGHDREGTPEFLDQLGRRRGFTVAVADFLLQGGARVSSSAIRDALLAGDLESMPSLLGRRFAVVGKVIVGDGRGGGTLGYPTANLEVAADQAVPTNGIYATWAYVDEIRYRAAASIGVRPTFGRGNARTIEAYLLDFRGDLYGKHVRLEFVQRLRDELEFTSIGALRKQIARDVEDTRRVLA